MPNHKWIDMDTYPRKSHFEYYQNSLPCGYSITITLDLSHFLEVTKEYKFYPSFIYIVSKTVNCFDFLKMMVKDNRLGVWDVVHPNFTIFHKDDETFSDIWVEYKEDFKEFYQEYTNIMDIYGNNHGIKARDHQPPNFYCISCVPWLDFDAYSTYSTRGAALFPIITYGKIKEDKTVSFTISISHASCDGYHASKFLNTLQDNLNSFVL